MDDIRLDDASQRLKAIWDMGLIDVKTLSQLMGSDFTHGIGELQSRDSEVANVLQRAMEGNTADAQMFLGVIDRLAQGGHGTLSALIDKGLVPQQGESMDDFVSRASSQLNTAQQQEAYYQADATQQARAREAGFVPDPSYAPGGANSTSGSTGGSTGSFGSYDASTLKNSAEFKALSSDDQQAVLAVFEAIAGNDKVMADRLAQAFQAASKINDPYFKQAMTIATDAIERGYVAIDQEAEFAEMQLAKRLEDLREDIATSSEFLSLEHQQTLKDIERAYTKNLEVAQENLAASGFGSSSKRIKTEGLLDEARGDLVESSTRRFDLQMGQNETQLSRGERDTAAEIERLKELTEAGKLDFLRRAESQIGSGNLSDLGLAGAPTQLGGLYGDIPRESLQNTLNAATSFVF